MWRSRESRFDVASAISQGKRDYQEDSLVTDFPHGADFGFAVLADGMGGHAAGDTASKIIVTEVFSELKFQSNDLKNTEANMQKILREAATFANSCIEAYVAENPDTKGMGATLVAPVILENRLFWISIGDSPLFLFRKGILTQLNEDHSMAPQIDLMVRSGLMDEETGRDHPDRNCLTSVLIGGKVAQIDCPEAPTELMTGDIIVVASDGLQFLDNDRIERILTKSRKKRSAEIAEILLEMIERLGDPDQDNVSFTVIKVNHTNQTSIDSELPVAVARDEEKERLAKIVVEEELAMADTAASKGGRVTAYIPERSA